MIAAEIKTDVTTVRIHDEFCSSPSQECISHLNQIVSNSYRRRSMVAEAASNTKEESMQQ